MANRDGSDLTLRDCFVCGHAIPKQANYCPKCGSPLTKKDPGIVTGNGGSLAPSERNAPPPPGEQRVGQYGETIDRDRAKVVEITFPVEGIVKCPYCAEDIQASARKCKHCGEWLRSTGDERESRSNQLPKQFWIAIAFVCAILIGLTTRSFPVAVGIFVLAVIYINLRQYNR